MNKLNKTKLVVLAAFAALSVFAAAASGWFSGSLGPGQKQTIDAGSWTRGELTISAEGFGYGDLDMYVYADGRLVGKDTMDDNIPEVTINLSRTQHIQVVMENADRYDDVDFEGEVGA